MSSEPEPERWGRRPDRVAVIAEPELPGVLELLEEEELRNFLHQNAVQPPSAGRLTPDT